LNAVVIVTTVEGKVNTHTGVTLLGALQNFFEAMDNVCCDVDTIKSIELFTKFKIDACNSFVAETLRQRGLLCALQQ